MQAALKNVMTTDLFVIPAGSPLRIARDLMDEKRIRHLPVVNASQEIVGILSQNPLFYLESLEDLSVNDVMVKNVLSIDQHAPLRYAIFRFLENKVSSLLVVDQNKAVIGIITTDDLLWYLSTLLEDAKQKRFSFSSLFDLQTVGEVARQVASVGL